MTPYDPLTILLGGAARIKLLRFFLFNPQHIFSFETTARRARLVRRTARTELGTLERAGVIQRKHLYETVPSAGKRGSHRRRVLGYTLEPSFPLLAPLQAFLFATAPINSKTMLAYIKKAGGFELVVAAGVFKGEFERRIDILLVSKNASAHKVEQAVRALEAELGIEVKYASLKTDDFMYRLGMRDKLVRDVFDYPHEIVVDKLGVHDELARK